jgi:hypothetical protein
MIDTKSYMVGAYTVATAIYLTYVTSLWNRARRTSRNLAVALEAKDRAGAERDASRSQG